MYWTIGPGSWSTAGKKAKEATSGEPAQSYQVQSSKAPQPEENPPVPIPGGATCNRWQ